jgi:hypothetical protein
VYVKNQKILKTYLAKGDFLPGNLQRIQALSRISKPWTMQLRSQGKPMAANDLGAACKLSKL